MDIASLITFTFLGFCVGVCTAYLLLHNKILFFLEKKYAQDSKLNLYNTWVSAWKFCVFCCLNEWDDKIEKFAVKSAEKTFDDWSNSL